MDIIQEVVRTEKEQADLLVKTQADLSKKLEQKEEQLQQKFLKQKEEILAAHAVELDKLRKSFATKQKRQKAPVYELTDMKPILKDLLQQLKWQLKK